MYYDVFLKLIGYIHGTVVHCWCTRVGKNPIRFEIEHGIWRVSDDDNFLRLWECIHGVVNPEGEVA